MGRKKGEPFQATNWKQLSPREIEKLSLIEKSRYFAYEPSPHIEKIKACRQRVLAEQATRKERQKQNNYELAQARERMKRDVVLGEHKATEARARLNNLRDNYQKNRLIEITRLISNQQTALKSVRLQALLPESTIKCKFADVISRKYRMRIEKLMEDDLCATTGRILC